MNIDKGRIVIPRNLRQKLDLHESDRVRLVASDRGILITKPIPPEEFIDRMEGCVKPGSPIPKIKPLEIKKIWEQT